MTPLVSGAAKLQAIIGDSYDTARCDAALSWASSEIRSYCNQDFDQKTDDEVIISPTGMVAFLPQTPVTAVSKVEMRVFENGVPQAWTDVENFMFEPSGVLFPTTVVWSYTSWPTGPQSLRVTYTHGYETVPQPIQDVCLRLAASAATNPTFLVRHQVGLKQDEWAVNGGSKFSQFDQIILDRYTIVGIS